LVRRYDSTQKAVLNALHEPMAELPEAQAGGSPYRKPAWHPPRDNG